MPCRYVSFCGNIQFCTHPDPEAVPRSPKMNHCLSLYLASEDPDLICYDEAPARELQPAQLDLFADSSQVIAERIF